jgi:hypothetical protein
MLNKFLNLKYISYVKVKFSTKIIIFYITKGSNKIVKFSTKINTFYIIKSSSKIVKFSTKINTFYITKSSSKIVKFSNKTNTFYITRSSSKISLVVKLLYLYIIAYYFLGNTKFNIINYSIVVIKRLYLLRY